MNEFIPELGQAIFGQPHKRYTCSDELEAAIGLLAALMPYNENPFSNSGHSQNYGAFQASAYSWGDEDQPWNFKWKDIEVSWYKYFGRSMSANREVLKKEVVEMLLDCLPCVPISVNGE